MNTINNEEKFLVLARINPITGNTTFCVHGGYHWSDDVCDAKQYTNLAPAKALASKAKKWHQEIIDNMNDPNNTNTYWKDEHNGTPLVPYVYQIIEATKRIELDWANSLKV